MKPVDGCTIHQSRKLPCTCPQCEPHWGETQDDLEHRVGGERSWRKGEMSNEKERNTLAQQYGNMFK